MKSGKELWVIMPVYNEQESLRSVVDEWLECLRHHEADFTLCLINDGSTDGSLAVIRELENGNAEILVLDKRNTGHGRTCMEGYQLALSSGARHIFQIDSDGQCDPADFSMLWTRRDDCPAVFGKRTRRADSLVRRWMSGLLRAQIALLSGVSVPDANVPYRLMRASVLADALNRLPEDVDLVNLFLGVVIQHHALICWVDIGFRRRSGGAPTVGLIRLARKSIALAPQLYRLRRGLKRPMS